MKKHDQATLHTKQETASFAHSVKKDTKFPKLFSSENAMIPSKVPIELWGLKKSGLQNHCQ